jgi:hypothetical protein
LLRVPYQYCFSEFTSGNSDYNNILGNKTSIETELTVFKFKLRKTDIFPPISEGFEA